MFFVTAQITPKSKCFMILKVWICF